MLGVAVGPGTFESPYVYKTVQFVVPVELTKTSTKSSLSQFVTAVVAP